MQPRLFLELQEQRLKHGPCQLSVCHEATTNLVIGLESLKIAGAEL